jgi:hypothetical protein
VVDLNQVNFNKQTYENIMDLLNLAMLIQRKNSTDLAKLKLLSSELNERYIMSKNITSNTTIVGGDTMFSSQIYTSDDKDSVVEESSLKDKFPILNIKPCERILRQYYNISSLTPIVYVKKNYNPVFNPNQINTYILSAYEATNKTKLDINLCKNITQSIQIPLTNLTNFNLTKYQEIKKLGIDIYNPNDPYFNDRCLGLVDNQTNYDTTVNWRINNYYETTIPECNGLDCAYSGIDENNFVNCTCNLQDDEYYVKPVYYIKDSLTRFNFEVIQCPQMIPVSKYLN